MNKTRVAYKEAFGDFPPSDVWQLSPSQMFLAAMTTMTRSLKTIDTVDEKIEPLK